MHELLLCVEGVTKIYGSQKALDNMSFDLYAGEVHCLVGENGAGKSTFIKILSGAVSPDAGQIHILGKTSRFLTPSEAITLGISTIYQDVELIDSLTVADNIFLGSERRSNIPGVVDTKRQFQQARKIMNRLNITIDERALVEDLSAAQKQTLQIVKALHSEAKILIMDEPTSSLGLEETKALMQLVKDLAAKGIGIIYISHYLEEIFEIGDRITILKDGQYVETYNAAQVDVNTVIRSMVGRDASIFFSRERATIGETQFEIKHFSYKDVVKDVSFSVNKGEVFGLGGLVGAGRTELADLLVGIEKSEGGEMLLNGNTLSVHSPQDAIRQGICLITEDRKKFGLFGTRSVKENVALVHNELSSGPLLNLPRETSIVDSMIRKLQIVVSGQAQNVMHLSGGNQQKTIIARFLSSDATVFIFDEPTKGVDIGAKEEIYKLIVQLAKNGKSVIMISSDMPELISLSDRIGVMRQGQLTHILPAHEAKEEELIKHFIGVE
ncbi:sugar ABC transporter ATP-binding protein [candidate division KSB3 bacterium]|uniref:Sugar ABC transporter ATP-binding protein n=1 Tax=candidate division KSB3 bacterium TaxID=2044937 RepID=A0A2G6KEW6_9BACT|nr:MAG: sugar ABC transporter ATP-binding protein [candidate division KSB3 bacterium]